MCHSFRRGTMQMYQIREANSGGKSKKVVVYICLLYTSPSPRDRG